MARLERGGDARRQGLCGLVPQHDLERLDALRTLLCRLEDHVLAAVSQARDSVEPAELAAITEETAADTIFRIDKIAERAIIDWAEAHWPQSEPAEFVMEGVEGAPLVFPSGIRVESTRWKCILDPIDGTRVWMHDKRSAWALAAVAPQRGAETKLSDIVVAAMTELPTSKQWRADQLSAVRGTQHVTGTAIDVRAGIRARWNPKASTATDYHHGFAGISKFFPQGKALLADLEEAFWAELHGREPQAAPLVFDDQYISTGGQIYELASGRDRMWADVRPMVFRKLGMKLAMTCHPYDICTAMILEELGGIVESPDGSPLDAPLDTTSPVSWIGYANHKLADLARPALQRLVKERLGPVGLSSGSATVDG
jgi:fructose-1,6-bisphosphatase/inositol monophosphatase family enzyme